MLGGASKIGSLDRLEAGKLKDVSDFFLPDRIESI